MSNNKQQTAVDTLIVNFKESISYLESALVSGNHELTKIQIKARLSQARYFLTYTIEAKEMEKEKHEKFNKFLNYEKQFGISDLKTIERIHWKTTLILTKPTEGLNYDK